MAADFSVTYTLTAKEETRARRANILRRKTTWVVPGAVALFLVLLFTPEVLAVLRGDKPPGSLLPEFLLFSGFIVFNTVVLGFSSFGMRSNGADKEVTVSSEGVSAQSPVARRLLYWVNFTSARETGEFFLLRTGGQTIWPVPKRELADSAALQGLRELIREHVPDARLLDQPA